MTRKFYRYEDYLTNWDYYNNRAIVVIKLIPLYLIKETPKGYWISEDSKYKETESHFSWAEKRWVSKTTQKRFAYPTKEEAREAFKARKNRQIIILSHKLDQAKKALKAVNLYNQ